MVNAFAVQKSSKTVAGRLFAAMNVHSARIAVWPCNSIVRIAMASLLDAQGATPRLNELRITTPTLLADDDGFPIVAL